jgi:tetratricopeptide (TPR) repeat protein
MFMKIKTLLQGTLVLTLSSILMVQGALAQGGSRADRKDDEAPPTNQIDQRTGEILTEAIEFLNNDQNAQARAKLGELTLDRLSPYERSRVEQMFFSLDVQEENYPGARQHMEAAINSGGLNDQEISQGRYQLAQLYMQEEKWAEGAKALEDWLKTAASPNGGVYYLLAAAYYNLDNFDAALPHARKAVEMTETPQEGWLQMLSALLLQKEQYKDALPVIQRQVNMFPTKKVYWTQLSSVHAQLEDMSSALVIMQMAYHAGLLSEGSEYQRLADFMMVNDMPYSAGELITKAIDEKKIEPDLKTWESLSNSWIAAREFRKAVPILARAGQLSGNGNDFLRLGEVNIQMSEWGPAAEALEEALNKGGLRDAAYAQLMLGISLYNQDKLREAKTWFERAANSQSQSKTARGYIQLIDSKLN